MEDDQEEMLDKIRQRVLERERDIQLKQDKEANLQATLQALEEVTDVPREEMERIANEIRATYEHPDQPVKTEPKNCLPTERFEKLPATVRDAMVRLPPILQEEFFEEYIIQERKLGLSYLLWLIPPPFSCHYLYNKRWFTQILYLITSGGLFVWWIVDFFRIPQIVLEENRNTARKLLKKMMKNSLKEQRQKKRLGC